MWCNGRIQPYCAGIIFIILIMQHFIFSVNSILLCHMDLPATYCYIELYSIMSR